MSKRHRPPVHPLRVLTLLGGALGCYAGISVSIAGHAAVGYVVFIASCVVILAGEVWNHRKRQSDWFLLTFRTYENFRAEVNLEELREVRRARGDMATVRYLKLLYPKLPPSELTRLLKDL
ncbi:hypothetical protein [Streptomyces luteolus]|uniref:Uncharacterized protein n=1 Tax=Streptomyces luteolus TaxID=3043615 RepID=A0ABT6SV61_9ACTN|nr:hypothetical protein [Streptomyces sp. B-S-A12]MDI3419497.1 hypothetical protein [Streptomyces sp. B-S-A12]